MSRYFISTKETREKADARVQSLQSEVVSLAYRFGTEDKRFMWTAIK